MGGVGATMVARMLCYGSATLSSHAPLSARSCVQAVHDPKYGAVFVSMVHNLVESLAGANLVHIEVRRPLRRCHVVGRLTSPRPRAQVSFGATPSSSLMSQLDAAIGRTAHISFLDNDVFVSMFVSTYLAYFV